MKNQLVQNYFWNTIGTSLNSFISLFLLILITRINGINDSGLFSFCFALTTAFYTIGLYGGRIYQVSDIKSNFSNNTYVSQKIVTSFLMVIIAIIFVLINSYSLFKTLIIMMLLGNRVCEAISDSLYGILQQKDKLDIVGKSLSIKTLIGLLLFVIINIIAKNIVLASSALLIINILIIFVYDIKHINKICNIKLEFDKKILLIMKKSIYIFLFSFLSVLIVNVQRYFVDIYFDNFSQGYFGIIIMPATLIVLFAFFIIQPNILSLSELHKNKNYKQYKKIINKILFVCIVFGILATIATYLIAGEILSYIYGINLVQYKIELATIVLGGVFNTLAVVYSNSLTIVRNFKEQVYNYIITLVLSILISMLIIKNFGIAGATISYLITMIIQYLLFLISYLKIFRRE